MWAKSPTQRTHVNDQSPSVTAAACPTGGAPGPCRGRSLDSPRGERVRSLDSPPGPVHVCTHTHTHVCVGALHMCALPNARTRHTCARHTMGAHAVCTLHVRHTACVTYTTHVHMLLHSHAHACFPAPRAPGFPCPAQPHHQAC